MSDQVRVPSRSVWSRGARNYEVTFPRGAAATRDSLRVGTGDCGYRRCRGPARLGDSSKVGITARARI